MWRCLGAKNTMFVLLFAILCLSNDVTRISGHVIILTMRADINIIIKAQKTKFRSCYFKRRDTRRFSTRIIECSGCLVANTMSSPVESCSLLIVWPSISCCQQNADDDYAMNYWVYFISALHKGWTLLPIGHALVVTVSIITCLLKRGHCDLQRLHTGITANLRLVAIRPRLLCNWLHSLPRALCYFSVILIILYCITLICIDVGELNVVTLKGDRRAAAKGIKV